MNKELMKTKGIIEDFNEEDRNDRKNGKNKNNLRKKYINGENFTAENKKVPELLEITYKARKKLLIESDKTINN
ncbi:hypothetical protein C1645_833331 [Glomus cerebriforme]|uniref:Uncharacterized protein n=1 Tax=Glomus cerebriforme TaxID=658196 RepID=A0A397SFU6_9GLOM|nr:hypothetical protein C1645_833331 [Glomus cerebriforme]